MAAPQQLSGTPFSDPRLIARALFAAGYKVWIDVDQLRAGQDLHSQLASALDTTSVAIACLSDEYCLSKNCNLEISYIVDQSLPIIVVVVGETENNAWKKSGIKFKIGSPLYIDFRGIAEAAGFEEKMRELLMALHARNVRPASVSVLDGAIVSENARAGAVPSSNQLPPLKPQNKQEETPPSPHQQQQLKATPPPPPVPPSPEPEQDPDSDLSSQEILFACAKDGDTGRLKNLLARHGFNMGNSTANRNTPLQLKKLLDAVDEREWSPLLTACYHGNLGVVTILLKAGADVNRTSGRNGWTPLGTAALQGHIDIVQYLVLKNADIESVNKQDWSVLYSACHNGHENCVRWLIDQGCDINRRNENAWSPLMSAANGGHLGCVMALTDSSGWRNSLDDKNGDGATALFLASMNGSMECVEYLVGLGASVNIATNVELTPLHAAASMGFIQVVSFLIESGADVNALSAHKWTPLHAASFGGHLEVVREIVHSGIRDVDGKNQDGCTALHLAAGRNFVAVVAYLHGEQYCSAESPNNRGWTPLYVAAALGHYEMVQFLIVQVGAKVDSRSSATEGSWTPLNASAFAGHSACAEILIIGGADINATNDDGETPLWSAAYAGHVEVVKILLDRGAKKSLAAKDGKTALDVARGRNYTEIISLLDPKPIRTGGSSSQGSSLMRVNTTTMATTPSDSLHYGDTIKSNKSKKEGKGQEHNEDKSVARTDTDGSNRKTNRRDPSDNKKKNRRDPSDRKQDVPQQPPENTKRTTMIDFRPVKAKESSNPGRLARSLKGTVMLNKVVPTVANDEDEAGNRKPRKAKGSGNVDKNEGDAGISRCRCALM